MNQLNSIISEGNVVRNGDFYEPTKGFKVFKFPIAVNRFSKNSNGDAYEEVSYFDVEAYGKIAETCEKNVSKGRGIRVVGRLKQDRWKNEEGKNFSKIFVVAEHVEYKPKFNNEERNENTKKSVSKKNSNENESDSSENKAVYATSEIIQNETVSEEVF